MNTIPNLTDSPAVTADLSPRSVTSPSTSSANQIPKPLILVVILLVAGLGVLTGYLASRGSGETTTNSSSLSGGVVDTTAITAGSEFGAKDASKYTDTATGVVQKGGLDGEGTHQLLREGGPSQTVYLTSSNLDLDQFAGRKVTIWGETFSSRKAGWFMDVARIKVLE